MLDRLRARLAGTDERAATIAALREQDVIGILTLTGNPELDARLNRSMLLPAGLHLWSVDREASATAEGQMMLRVRATLLNERTPKAATLSLPSGGTLLLLADNDEVHTWDVSDLLERAATNEDAAADLYELELHLQQLAMAAAMKGFEPADSMRWPGDG